MYLQYKALCTHSLEVYNKVKSKCSSVTYNGLQEVGNLCPSPDHISWMRSSIDNLNSHTHHSIHHMWCMNPLTRQKNSKSGYKGPEPKSFFIDLLNACFHHGIKDVRSVRTMHTDDNETTKIMKAFLEQDVVNHNHHWALISTASAPHFKGLTWQEMVSIFSPMRYTWVGELPCEATSCQVSLAKFPILPWRKNAK